MKGGTIERIGLAPWLCHGARIGILILTAALVVTTEFILIGLLPLVAENQNIPIERAGALVTVFALSAAMLGPPLTLYSNRFYAPRCLALQLVTLGLASLVAASWPHFWVLILVRVLQGALLTPFISIASHYAALTAQAGRSGKAIGQVNLGAVVGIVILTPLSLYLAEYWGWRLVFAGLGLATFFSAFMLLLQSQLAQSQLPRDQLAAGGARQFSLQGLVSKPLLFHLLLSLLLFTAMFCSYSYITAYLKLAWELEGQSISLALLGFGLSGLIGNHWASQLVDKNPGTLTCWIALLLAVTSFCLIMGSYHWTLMLILLFCWGGSHTAAFVTCQVRVMFAGRQNPAFAGSLNISACNLGIALGTSAGALTIEYSGMEYLGVAAGLLASITLGFSLQSLRLG